jgi:hypothetical protein
MHTDYEFDDAGTAPQMQEPDSLLLNKAEISLRLALGAQDDQHSKGITKEDAEILMRWICYYTRDKLAESIGGTDKFARAQSDLVELCTPAQSIASYAAQNLGLQSPPPFQLRTTKLFADAAQAIPHDFMIVQIPVVQEDKSVGITPYLVDTTFRQFIANRKIKRGLGWIDGAAYAMAQDDAGFALAQKLMRDGYVPLTEENARQYLTSFSGGQPFQGSALEAMLNPLNSQGYAHSFTELKNAGIDALSPLERITKERSLPTGPAGQKF